MPEQYRSRPKVPYRGRRVKLHVESGDVSKVEIRYPSAFQITGPHTLSEPLCETYIYVAVVAWMKFKVM